MMKYPKLLLTLFGATILFHSCSKEKSPENNNNNSKVKSYTEAIASSNFNFSMTYHLSYDGKNRITAITPEGSSDSKISFTYQSNERYSMELYNSGNLEIKQDYFLRNSLLDSTIQYNNSKDTMSEKYYYDANKRLVSKIEFEHDSGPFATNSIQFTYDEAGNMVKSTDSDRNIETFEYYPDLVYAMPVTAPFFENIQKSRLIKSSNLTRNGTVLKSSVSTYTFDSKDRISTITETLSDGTVLTKSFTYF